jgi:hypothetical protein
MDTPTRTSSVKGAGNNNLACLEELRIKLESLNLVHWIDYVTNVSDDSIFRVPGETSRCATSLSNLAGRLLKIENVFMYYRLASHSLAVDVDLKAAAFQMNLTLQYLCNTRVRTVLADSSLPLTSYTSNS